jgi:hypothetical protein
VSASQYCIIPCDLLVRRLLGEPPGVYVTSPYINKCIEDELNVGKGGRSSWIKYVLVRGAGSR